MGKGIFDLSIVVWWSIFKWIKAYQHYQGVFFWDFFYTSRLLKRLLVCCFFLLLHVAVGFVIVSNRFFFSIFSIVWNQTFLWPIRIRFGNLHVFNAVGLFSIKKFTWPLSGFDFSFLYESTRAASSLKHLRQHFKHIVYASRFDRVGDK